LADKSVPEFFNRIKDGLFPVEIGAVEHIVEADDPTRTP